MTYTRDQLISALANEWEYLCHESPEDDDMSASDYLNYLNCLSDSELIEETDTGDGYTLDEYMFNHS